MSLIIKGIDLPNKGYLTEITDVTIRQFADGKIQIEIPKTSMPYYRLYEAIQISKPHGRIIDAGKVYCYNFWEEQNLDEAPTILEAEE